MLSTDRDDPSGTRGPAGMFAERPDDASAARWRRGALAMYYIALMIANLALLTGAARVILTAFAGLAGFLLLVGALWRGGSGSVGTGNGGGAGSARWEKLGYVAILEAVAQVAITGQLNQTTALLLTLVGVGAAVTTRKTAMWANLLGCAGWAAAVVAQDGLRTPELGHYAGQLVMAGLLGCILHEALRRRQRELKVARDQLTAGMDRFENLFHASPAGVGIADENGVLVAVNPAFCELAGRPAEELIGARSNEYVDLAAAEDTVGRQIRYVRPDGSTRWFWLTVGRAGVLDRAKTRRWTLIHLSDVTDRHLAERTVRESDRLLAAVSAAARRIRTGEDARGTIIEAVRELAEADTVIMLEPDGTDLVAIGVVGADVLGTRVPLNGTSMIANVYLDGQPVFLADPAQDPRVSTALLKLVDGRSMMWQPVVADGGSVALLVVSWKTRITSVSDLRARAVALLADETALALEHERLLGRLEQMAYTDTLTGLSNRRAWQAGVAELLAASRASGRPLTVAIADLDHFKRYNDTHGHVAGDDLLTAVATAFRGQLRTGDLIARWGGEEFVVALPDCGDAEAAEILDRLRTATVGTETCSIGYAVWNGVESYERLLERADGALYAAKSAGRDRVHAAAGVALAS
ncbi:hypothetical protein Areg01_08040 [Actinoplanes regularis]|nr:hypothetical protein Areg01_08040 [Actinoplanes regularis]